MSNDGQDPKGYYYAPYQNDGPYATMLKTSWSALGSAVAGAAAEIWTASTGGSPVEVKAAGGLAGAVGGAYSGAIGHEAGFYIDNASAIEQNLETWNRQYNDPATWNPFSGFMDP